MMPGPQFCQRMQETPKVSKSAIKFKELKRTPLYQQDVNVTDPNQQIPYSSADKSREFQKLQQPQNQSLLAQHVLKRTQEQSQYRLTKNVSFKRDSNSPDKMPTTQIKPQPAL